MGTIGDRVKKSKNFANVIYGSSLDVVRVRAELGVKVGEVGGVAAAGHVALLVN